MAMDLGALGPSDDTLGEEIKTWILRLGVGFCEGGRQSHYCTWYIYNYIINVGCIFSPLYPLFPLPNICLNTGHSFPLAAGETASPATFATLGAALQWAWCDRGRSQKCPKTFWKRTFQGRGMKGGMDGLMDGRKEDEEDDARRRQEEEERDSGILSESMNSFYGSCSSWCGCELPQLRHVAAINSQGVWSENTLSWPVKGWNPIWLLCRWRI